MEVFFADVAQGAGAVLALGKQTAIVIDSGTENSNTIIDLLKKLRIEKIACLIATHNHSDHCGAATRILIDYRSRIDTIWMIDDTARSGSKFWACICSEIDSGHLTDDHIVRLERSRSHDTVYNDNDVILKVLSPTFPINSRARDSGKPNATSGVLVLIRYGTQVVFSGDSTIEQWQRIHALLNKPIKCLAFSVPHHAGNIWGPKKQNESDADFQSRIASALDWLYTNGINGEHAIISVGTNNSYGHPLKEVVSSIKRNGGNVICTQITSQCTTNLAAHQKSALPVVYPSQSCNLSGKKQRPYSAGDNVPCGQTVHLEILSTGASISRLQTHQNLVDNIKSTSNIAPLCR